MLPRYMQKIKEFFQIYNKQLNGPLYLLRQSSVNRNKKAFIV